MKTVLVYTRHPGTNYNQLFLSLLKEGRKRGWTFAFVEPATNPDDLSSLAEAFELLKPIGFVGNFVGKIGTLPQVRGVPAVWVDCPRPFRDSVMVRHDNSSFGRIAARALVSDGFHEYAVFGFKNSRWSGSRERAFVSSIREAGGRCRVVKIDSPPSGQYSAIGRVRAALERLPRPVSVFAVTDHLAGIVLMAAEALGLRCPRDIRLVGCDDMERICMSFATPISSVRPDWEEGGRLVAEALEIQMRGGPPKREYLYGASGVVCRATTREPYRRPVDARVEKALSFIAAEYASPVTVADVVRVMGGSDGHCRERFREETGKTILEALDEMRWQRVVTLLSRARPDFPSLHLACGFRTASGLRQFFRRRAGVSMTQWRALRNNASHPAE